MFSKKKAMDSVVGWGDGCLGFSISNQTKTPATFVNKGTSSFSVLNKPPLTSLLLTVANGIFYCVSLLLTVKHVLKP